MRREKVRKCPIKAQDSGKYEMAINVRFKFLKIVVFIEIRNLKGVTQVRSAGKEPVSIQVAVTSNYLNSEIVRPIFHSIDTFKFV